MNRLARACVVFALAAAAGLPPASARQPKPEAALQAARLAYE